MQVAIAIAEPRYPRHLNFVAIIIICFFTHTRFLIWYKIEAIQQQRISVEIHVIVRLLLQQRLK